MAMSRLLYERSVGYKGHLIIPFVYASIDVDRIYSYRLLSELGYQGKWNFAENPAGIYSSKINGIVEIAREHLDKNSDVLRPLDIFKPRYTYRDHLVIIYGADTRFFYDHYPPEELTNIAPHRFFKSEVECMKWIEEGLNRSSKGKQI